MSKPVGIQIFRLIVLLVTKKYQNLPLSRDIGLWFKNKVSEFILYKEAPEWFLAAGKDASDWTSEVQENFRLLKTMNKEYSDQVNIISNKAKLEMAKLDERHKDRLVSVLETTPELVFELFNSQMLPLEIHLKAFEYNTKEEAKSFMSKELLKFKENKFREFSEGEISLSDLIGMLFEK
jgi:hypothetical protein